MVERFHGMEEVRSSILLSSTLTSTLRAVGFALAGLIAGEGCFTVGALAPRVDGSPRLRFRLMVTMADRDRPMLTALRMFLGVGSIRHLAARRVTWQPTSTYSVTGRKGIREAVIPFCDTFLVCSAKRTQYVHWREQFVDYEARFPSNWGAGPSFCAIAGCDRPVRGRGLCRAHYYDSTGY